MTQHRRTAGQYETAPSLSVTAGSASAWRVLSAQRTARLGEASWLRVWGRVGAGTIGFPVAILLHELGHFFAFRVFGFQDVVLAYASVQWSGRQEFWHLIQTANAAAATAFAEPWQVAVAIGAGPAMTYLTVITCALLARGFGPSALVLAVGLAAPLRSLAVLPVLGHKLLGHELTTGFDETRVAILTHMPETLHLVPAVAFLVGGWWLLVRAVPRGQKWHQLAPVLVGMMVGGPVWLLWLGPWLLP